MKRKFKSRAFLLIEILVYIFLYSVIFSIATPIAFKTISCYLDVQSRSVNINKVEEFFIEMEKILSRDKDSITVDNDKINIQYQQTEIRKEISVILKEEGRVKISYYQKTMDNPIIKVGTNDLIADVDDINFYKKNNLVYITIKKGKMEFTRCFMVEKVGGI